MKHRNLLRDIYGRPGRECFRLDPNSTHLNHGSYGATPVNTLEYQEQLNRQLASNPLSWFDSLPSRMMQTRRDIAEFIGAPEREIAAVQNASAAASSVFNSLSLGPGEEIVVTDHIYGAIRMGAERLARRYGAVVRTVELPLRLSNEAIVDRVVGEISAKTRLLIIDHISSATARIFPVAQIAQALGRRQGLVILVDGAHSLGLMPSPALRQSNVVWFGNLHKFACAPSGAAVMVSQQPLADNWFPVIDSWGTPEGFPIRFDYQASSNTTAFLSAPHAIMTVKKLFGWDVVREFSAELGMQIRELVTKHIADDLYGLYDPAHPTLKIDDFLEDELPGAISQLPLLPLPGTIADSPETARSFKYFLRKELQAEVGVSTWRGLGLIRFSPHAYNTAAQYEKFLTRLVRVLQAA